MERDYTRGKLHQFQSLKYTSTFECNKIYVILENSASLFFLGKEKYC